ncbi:hypothetical protein AKJ59_00635 [candidate division MSBL1 archaeon SCGC-AAA385M02]|uniref:Uncharacterized protein n=1 Tax=candidate division MSBL1 archaeon SCGC-AAA385M02 TaxID=1698287 RepID=A0A133VQE3_9EURY|nr:hypothetical protein AKJ59_00635 [candidate division MSBL1 archaeon SCGC-AAA385M02]
MPTVYAFDSSNPPVKIAKHGKYWCVYRLRGIKKAKVIFKDPMKLSEVWYKFRWSDKPTDSYTYKPFEDDDIFDKPNISFVKETKTYNNHLVSWDIHNYGYHEALKNGYKRLG